MVELVVKFPYIDSIVTHVKKNKKVYILGGSVVIAGITTCIMRGRIGPRALSRGPSSLLADGGVNIRPLSFFSKQTNHIWVTIKQEIGRPPYLVHDLTSDLWYSSQYSASKALGASESMVSRHINGKLPHVQGHILERIPIEA